MAPKPETRPRMLIALATMLLGVLLLAGCGPSDTAANDVPSLSGKEADGKSATTTTVDPEQAVQDFVACLRAQGLDVADPKMGSDGRIDMRSIFENADIQPGSDAFRTAQQACGDKLANAGFGPNSEEREQRQEAMLAFTSCLRKEGLNVGDITFNGPGGRPDGGGFGPGAPGGGETSTPGGTAGGTANSVPDGPGRDGPAATPEERTARLAERLGVDANAADVKAAFAACDSELTAITTGGPGGPGATTTTQG